MDAKELQERYKKMEAEELVSIVFNSKNEYTKEAIQAATVELNNRNVALEAESTLTMAKDIRKRREKEEIEIKTKPLTKTQKIWFTLLPGISFWYAVSKGVIYAEEKQRIKDAIKCFYRGLALWLFVSGIVLIVIKLF